MGILDGKTKVQPASKGGILNAAQTVIDANRMNQDDMAYSEIMKTQQPLKPYVEPTPQLPGRDIPVVGPILKGLDWVASNPVSKAVAEYTVPDAPYVNETPSLTDLITGKMPTAREEFLKRSGQEPATGASKFVGQAISPFFVPGAQLGTGTAASEAAQTVLSKAAPKLQGVGQIAAREALAGGAIGAGSEFAQGQGDLGNAAKSAALGAAVGGAGGTAVGILGRYLDGLANKAAPKQEPLGLPDPTLALPSPKVVEPTTAKATSSANPYRDKLENLFNEAKKMQANGEIRPGYEREALDDIWSRMAGPNDPGLDELITQAYAPKPNRLQPDLVQKAKQYQQSRLAAGVDLPVRTNTERYREGVISEAAAPRTKFVTQLAEQAAAEPAQTMKGNWFTNLFGNRGVGISAFNSSKRLSKGPLSTEDQIVKNGIRNDINGLKESAAAQARAVYQNFVDQLDPLKRISTKTYDSAMDASRANNIANTIIRDKFVNPEGVVIGEGLANIFKKAARGQDNQFVDYITLRHAKTRMERGERVFDDNVSFNGQKMTPEVVQKRIDMYNKRHPEFANIAKEWDQFNDNVLKHYGVNEGLISEDLYKALREKNPYYSPMRRQFSRSEKPGRTFLSKTTSSSFSGQKAPIKEVSPTGSVRNIIDPRKTTIESVGAWANAAMRNRVMQSMVDVIKRDPEAFKGVAEIVQKPNNATDLRKVLLEGGEDEFVEALNQDFKNLFKTTKVDQDNVVRAMVNGEPVYIQVHDPEIVKTLIGMGPQTSNLIMDTLTALSNATKRGATGMLAPVFAVKGATMDLVQSAIQSKDPLKQAGYTVYGLLSGIGDRLRIPGLKNLAEEYRRAGGEYSAALKGDMQLNKGISDMTRDPFLSPKGIAKGALTVAKSPFKALESIGNIAENAPRMAAYKLELNRLGGERTPENILQAMSRARESTVNFSRRGAYSRNIESLVPYNNAAVQGTYRVMKAFKENPVKTTAAIGALAVLPKMYEYMQFADDPDYQKLPARERMRFLIVNKNDDGSFTKIPMEPAYNSIGEMTIEALRYFKDKDPNAFKDTADALANAWLPPAATGALQGITQGGGLDKSIPGALNSTVAAPFVAVTSNQSFTGAPIESKAVQDRSPENRYDEKTSSIAKQLSKYIGLSPMKTDYLIRAYGGDPARLLLPLTSQVGAGNTRNTLLRNFIVDPELTNTLTNDFYGGKEKLTQAYRDNKEVGTPLPSWFSEELYKEVTSQAKGSISKKLADLSEQKKKINADTRLNAEQKAKNLRVIQSQMNDIYMDINTEMYKQKVPTR